MAKGNGIMRKLSGKAGNLVFAQNGGTEYARAYNPDVKNPRSQAQAEQRKKIAPIVSLYQAGREIFNHAFEGYSVGGKSYSRFLQLNLLQNLSAARYKGEAGITPAPYIVSRGSLPLNFSSSPYNGEGSLACFSCPNVMFVANNTGGATATYADYDNFLKNRGFEDGENITFLALVLDTNSGDGSHVSIISCKYTVGSRPDDNFGGYIENSGSNGYLSVQVRSEIDEDSEERVYTLGLTPVGDMDGDDILYAACIRTRFENGKWRNSNGQFVMAMTEFAMDYIAERRSLENQVESTKSYMNGASSVGSDLYLRENESTLSEGFGTLSSAMLIGQSVPNGAHDFVITAVDKDIAILPSVSSGYTAIVDGTAANAKVYGVKDGNLSVPVTLSGHEPVGEDGEPQVTQLVMTREHWMALDNLRNKMWVVR